MPKPDTNTPAEIRARRRDAFIANLPDGLDPEFAVRAWMDHANFMAEVFSNEGFDLVTEREAIANALSQRRLVSDKTCAKCGAKALKGRNLCKRCNYQKKTGKVWSARSKGKPKAKRRRMQPSRAPEQPNARLRRARGDGECSKCGKRYRKGDKLAGTKVGPGPYLEISSKSPDR